MLMVHIVQHHMHLHPHGLLLRKACIVAITPVSIPLSNLIKDELTLVSYKYSRYQRSIKFGSELLAHIGNHSNFLVAVSIQPYIAKGVILIAHEFVMAI